MRALSKCLRQGCERAVEAFGLCRRHGVQFRREEPQRYEWLRSLSGEARRVEIEKMRSVEKAKIQPPHWEYEGREEELIAQFGQDSK